MRTDQTSDQEDPSFDEPGRRGSDKCRGERCCDDQRDRVEEEACRQADETAGWRRRGNQQWPLQLLCRGSAEDEGRAHERGDDEGSRRARAASASSDHSIRHTR